MITVSVVLNEDGVLKRLEIEGHSGYSVSNDVVCAGVSVLSQSFYLSLTNIPGCDYLFEDKEGKFLVVINDYDELYIGELRGISLLLAIGLEALSEKYKNNVKIRMSKGE